MVRDIQNTLLTRIRDIDAQIAQLTQYLLVKVKSKDWHAVADAAMDIRELESEKRAADKIVMSIYDTRQDEK